MTSRDKNNIANNRKLSSYFTRLRPPLVPPTQQQPPLPPPPPPSNTPQRVSTTPTKPAVNLEPYPHPPQSFPTPHPRVTIDPIKTAHIPSLMRITGLLLPIRYPTSFYSATITDPLIASVSRVAIYHDHPVTGVTLPENTFAESSSSAAEKVIGGIRCRLEPLLVDSGCKGGRAATNLYIQTLHLLSPYRGKGIAASSLYSLIYDGPTSTTSMRTVSALVKHYNIRTVTAHVHETNEEALQWYIARGFTVQDGVIEGYYRKLKPGGAKIVKLELSWEEDQIDSGLEPSGPSQRSVGGHVVEQDGEDDDEWEKVDPAECATLERLEEYQQVCQDGDGDGDGDESASKRIRSIRT
ncbi:acetyltransferase (GNAT) family protein [Emydomyces testavorans]|uniref:Acetyltransferase (GNAT) family protein n=1 Tax=Emydomyces testavorans TaxID=2070801 RepID=A0AAF0DFN0_9EURO|nr:acetyltransferase (GNAT) family protein [Emydomyces testavorans]